MIQRMLAIWSLVPLPFLKPAWTSGSSWFMYYWSLAWRILSITNVWDECNCVVVSAFFGIAFLWDWSENWHFRIPVATAAREALGIALWNSLTWIPLLPLALFILMLPKAHLTSHFRISGSRRVVTPLWLSWSLRYFLHSSPMYSCHLFLISPASVRSIQFLFFIEPIFAWNVPLVSLIFLKRSLVFLIL